MEYGLSVFEFELFDGLGLNGVFGHCVDETVGIDLNVIECEKLGHDLIKWKSQKHFY